MNISESRQQLEKALCTLEILEQAKSKVIRVHRYLSEGTFPNLMRKTRNEIDTLERFVIPRLEKRYREQLLKAQGL